MADKIVVMKDGFVEQTGAPLELCDNPVNTFVAGFIGSPAMNLLPATMANGNITLGPGAVLAEFPGVENGRSIIAGVRPEDFVMGQSGVEGRVSVIEPTGAETQLIVRLDCGPVTLTTRERITARMGDVVKLSVAPGKLHCFDTESGVRMRLREAS